MKAVITISGQPNGNFYLKSKIASNGNYTSIENGRFTSFYINFDTVGEAKKALKGAWKDIKSESESKRGRYEGLSKDFTNLHYDASEAKINKI